MKEQMVISRYALHHFPDIQKSISEVSRVIKPKGFLFISDPTPTERRILLLEPSTTFLI